MDVSPKGASEILTGFFLAAFGFLAVFLIHQIFPFSLDDSRPYAVAILWLNMALLTSLLLIIKGIWKILKSRLSQKHEGGKFRVNLSNTLKKTCKTFAKVIIVSLILILIIRIFPYDMVYTSGLTLSFRNPYSFMSMVGGRLICALMGGSYEWGHWGDGRCHVVMHPDGGKACTDSSQCVDRCVIPRPYYRMEEPDSAIIQRIQEKHCIEGVCYGRCTRYPAHSCNIGIPISVRDGKISFSKSYVMC